MTRCLHRDTVTRHGRCDRNRQGYADEDGYAERYAAPRLIAENAWRCRDGVDSGHTGLYEPTRRGRWLFGYNGRQQHDRGRVREHSRPRLRSPPRFPRSRSRSHSRSHSPSRSRSRDRDREGVRRHARVQHVQRVQQFAWLRQRCKAEAGTSAPGAARGLLPPEAALQASKRINARLIQARDARELLCIHAEHGARFNNVNLATCWCRLGRVGCGKDFVRQLEALREQTLSTLSTWGARGLANLAHALAKLELRGGAWCRTWEAVARAMETRRGEFDSQGLANMAWAYVTAGHATPALLDCIAVEAAHLREFNPQELTNIAWAYAKAGHAAPVLFRRIEANAARRLREFTSQNLANTVWAYAKAGHAAPALFHCIAAEAVVRGVREFKPQDLASTAWAYATTGHVAHVLFGCIKGEAARRIREFNPQALAITAWAYAKSGHSAPELFDCIAAEAAQRVREFSPQNLANTAWAFATASHSAPELFECVASEAGARVPDFNPNELANMAWAYAKAGHAAEALLGRIATEAAPRLRDFNQQNLVNTVWAYATAGHAAPVLFACIAAEVMPRVKEFNPQSIANTAWAYAKAGHVAPALFDAIAEKAAALVDEFTSQDLANTAWAFAATNHPIDGLMLFGPRFVRRCEDLKEEYTVHNLCQLHQWTMWHSGERGRTDSLLSDELLKMCLIAFRSNERNPSKLQRHVGVALAALGLRAEEEVVLHEGYSLDFVVEWRGKRVGVEVDGPFHFLGHAPTGGTLLKRRQLRHLGWCLVSVPYWEWCELQHVVMADKLVMQAAYLRSRLDDEVPAVMVGQDVAKVQAYAIPGIPMALAIAPR